MRYVFCSLLLVAFAVAAPVNDSPQEKPFLVIPLVAPAQEQSEALTALLESWKKDKMLEQVDRWERLVELPEWAFDPKKREIGYVPPRPMIVQDYRYAIITNADGEVIVVRAGGIGDTYEIFMQKKAQPASQTDAGDRPSSSDSPASERSSTPAPRG